MNVDNVDSLSNLFPHSKTFKLGPSKRNADCADSGVEPSQNFEFRYMSRKTNIDSVDLVSNLFTHFQTVKLYLQKLT